MSEIGRELGKASKELGSELGKLLKRSIRPKRRLSISGLCHTLTLEETEVLRALDDYARFYGRDYADLLWIARRYQERFIPEGRRKTVLLKSSIDATRNILHSLWRKGMAQPEEITLRATDRIYVVKPKTKKEALEKRERWRITLAGHECINPPPIVTECIKRKIEEEERKTGKVTPMKAFRECWRKYELGY